MSKEQEELVTKVQALLVKRFGDTTEASMRKLFDHYDTNRDQKISASELEVLLKDAGVGNGLTRGAWVKGIIKNLDTSGDQLIDWDEFSKAVG
ncbi:MAG: EF-hand domain-containing protein [Polyangiales bacterium]